MQTLYGKPLYNQYDIQNPFLRIMQSFFEKEYNYTGSLKDLHHFVQSTDLLTQEEKDYMLHVQDWKKDRNSVFIKKFHEFIDKDGDQLFNSAFQNFVIEYIKPLYPNETNLVVQKTPNLRISLPNAAAIGKNPKNNEPPKVVGLHRDADFGHPTTEVNYIIPITAMFGTNSFYFEPCMNSKLSTDKYNNVVLTTDKLFEGYLNQLQHYNKINDTNNTRISFDFRIIPFSKYDATKTKGTKFEIGNYYFIL